MLRSKIPRIGGNEIEQTKKLDKLKEYFSVLACIYNEFPIFAKQMI
jgi:hypothetical protein